VRHPKPNDNWISLIVGGSIVLLILYYCWLYVVAFLAICGVCYLIQEYRKNTNDQNRWR
jgi:hypothetical protein